MQKDNGYVETVGTEEIATANEGERTERKDPMQASAVLGKFKDVDALAKAYGCLQAEFTRRSQTLKKLQQEVDNLKAGQGDGDRASGVEKLRKNAAVRRAEEEKFDAYISGLEQANVRAEEPQTQQLRETAPTGGERDAPQGENVAQTFGSLKENGEGKVELTDICWVAGLGPGEKRDGSVAYYLSEPRVSDDSKGVGPFMMAWAEYLKA